MASNSIVDYLKNVGQSVKFAAIESVTEKTPNLQKVFGENNKKYVQELYKDVNQHRQELNMIDRIRNATVFKQISVGWDNLKDSIKTGKFKDDSRSTGFDEMEMMFAMMGDDFLGGDSDLIEAEMNGEETGSTNDHRIRGIPEITKGDALVATASATATKNAASTISKAIVRSAELTDITARKSANLQLRALQQQANILSSGFQQLSSSLHTINQFNNQVVITHAQNSRMFFEQATALAQERNAILREMLEMQRETFGATMKSNLSSDANDLTKMSKIFDKEKGFDLRAYMSLMQKRMKETPIGMMMMSIKMLPMMIGEVVQNPLHYIAKMGIDSIIDNSLKKAIYNIDQSISGMISTGLAKLANYGKDKATKNTLLGQIASFFGVRNENTRLSAVDTSKYNKEAIQWNGIAQKALVEVIPGHLRRIEAALTGEGERVFDLQSGKWSTMKKVANIEKDIDRKVFKETFSKEKNQLLNMMQFKNRGEMRDWIRALDSFFKGVRNRGMMDYNHIRERSSEYGDNENIVKAIAYMIHSGGLDSSQIFNLTNKINEGNAKKAAMIRDLSPANQSLINEATNNSYNAKWAAGTGSIYGANGKQKVDKNGRWLSMPFNDLTKLTDTRGYTLYDYQYNILQTLLNMQRSGGLGGGRPAGPVGPAGPSNGGVPIQNPQNIIAGGLVRTGNTFTNAVPSEARDPNSAQRQHAANLVQKAQEKSISRRSLYHPDKSGLDEGQKLDFSVERIKNASKEELEEMIAHMYFAGQTGKEYRANAKVASSGGIFGDLKSAARGLGVSSLDSFMEDMQEATSIADKFNVVGEALKSMTSAPQKIMTSVLTEADRFMYEFMFGNPVGTEKDENGQPIEGFFGKVTNEFGKTMDNLNNKFNEWFKDTFKKGAGGIAGFFKGVLEDYFNIDVDEKVEQAKRHVKKYTNKVKKGALSAGANLFGIAKEAVLGTAQDLGIYEPDEEEEQKKNQQTPPTAYRGIRKYDSKYGIGVVGPGEKIISPGRGKVLDNTTGYKAYALQYGDSVIPSYLNTSNAGRGRVTPQSLASQEYNEKSLAKNIARGNVPVLGTFSGANASWSDIGGWIGDLKRKEQERFEHGDGIPKLENAKSKRGFFHNFVNWMTGYNEPEFTEDQIKMQEFIKDIVNSATKAAIEANGGAFEDEESKGRSLTQASFEMAGKLRKSDVDLNTNEFQEALKEVLAMSENIKDPDFRDTLQFILNTAGYKGEFDTVDDSKKVRRSRRNNLFVGVNQFMDNAFGIDSKKAIDTADKTIRKNLPELAKGGTFGALLSTVLPLGGPLMGALVGAGASVLTNSKSFQSYMFGTEITDKDGNVIDRKNDGIVSRKTVKAIQKYMPDAKKYGITGALAGLVLPFGPLGGLMIGAGASFLKNNSRFQEFMFGEEGGLINKDRKERIKRALPNIGVATLGTLFLGPFGIVGNAMLGAGLGILSTTESFKRIMLGSKDRNGIRRGGLADIIRRQITDPFKKTMDGMTERLAKWFKDDLFNPLARTIKPFGRVITGYAKDAARWAADQVFGKTNQNNMSIFGKLGLRGADALLGRIRNAGGLGAWALGGVGSAIGSVAHGIENKVGKGLERHAFKKGYFEGDTTAQERLDRAAELGIDINNTDQYALGGLDQVIAKISQGSNAKEDLSDLQQVINMMQATKNGEFDLNRQIAAEKDNMVSSTQKFYDDYMKKNPNEKNPQNLYHKMKKIQEEMIKESASDEFDVNTAKGKIGKKLAKSGLPIEIQEQMLAMFEDSGAEIGKHRFALDNYKSGTAKEYMQKTMGRMMGFTPDENGNFSEEQLSQINAVLENPNALDSVKQERRMIKENESKDDSAYSKNMKEVTDPADKNILANQESQISELKVMNETMAYIARLLATNDPKEKDKIHQDFKNSLEKYKGTAKSDKVAQAIEDSETYSNWIKQQKDQEDASVDEGAKGVRDRYNEERNKIYDPESAMGDEKFRQAVDNDSVIQGLHHQAALGYGMYYDKEGNFNKEAWDRAVQGRQEGIWNDLYGATLKNDLKYVGGKALQGAKYVYDNAPSQIGAAIDTADYMATRAATNAIHDIKNSEAVQDTFNVNSMVQMGKDFASGIAEVFNDFFKYTFYRGGENSTDSEAMKIAKDNADKNIPPTATYGIPFFGSFAKGGIVGALGNGLKEGMKGFAKGAFGASFGGDSDKKEQPANNIQEVQQSTPTAGEVKSTSGMVAQFDHSKANGGAPDINTKDNVEYTSDADGNPVAITKGPDGTPMKLHNKDNEELEKKHNLEFSFKERSANALEAIANKLGAGAKTVGKAANAASGGLLGGLLDSIGGLINTLFLGLPVGTFLLAQLKKLPGRIWKLFTGQYNIIEKLTKLPQVMAEKFNAFKTYLKDLPGKIMEKVTKAYNGAKNLVSSVAKGFKNIGGKIVKGLMKHKKIAVIAAGMTWLLEKFGFNSNDAEASEKEDKDTSTDDNETETTETKKSDSGEIKTGTESADNQEDNELDNSNAIHKEQNRKKNLDKKDPYNNINDEGVFGGDTVSAAVTTGFHLRDKYKEAKFKTGSEKVTTNLKYMADEAKDKIKNIATNPKGAVKEGIALAQGKIRSFLQSIVSFVGKWFPGRTAGEAVSKFCKTLIERLSTPRVEQAMAKALARQASAAAAGAASMGIGSAVISAGFVIGSFISAFNNAASMFNIPEPSCTMGMKIIAGFVNCVHCALTMIPIIGLAIAIFIDSKDLLKLAIKIIGPAVGLSEDNLRQLQQGGDQVVANNVKAAEQAAKDNPDLNPGKGKDGKESSFFDDAKAVASGAWEGIKNVASSAWEGVKSVGSSLYNGAVSVKNKIFGSGKHSTYGRGGLFGTGFHSQLDPAIAGMGFNTSGDTEKQTVKDSACGPMAYANAFEKFDVSVDDKDIINKTKIGKEKNGGVPDYVLNKYAKDKGFRTKSIGTSAKDLANSLIAGNPLVLMGQNNMGETDKDPFAENPHYVTAIGLDKDGNAVVEDSDSYQPIKKYKLNDLAKSTTIATELSKDKEPKFSEGASLKEIMEWQLKHAGRSKYGKGPTLDEDPPFGSVAAHVAKRIGSQHPELYWAQMMFETGGPEKEKEWNAKHPEYGDIHNYGGFTWYQGMGEEFKGPPRPKNEGGYYAKFKSDAEFAEYDYNKVFKKWQNDIKDISDPDTFAKVLGQKGYYTSSPTEYAAGLKAHLNGKYKNSLSKLGGMAGSISTDSTSSNKNPNASDQEEQGIFGAIAQLGRKLGSVISIFGDGDSSSSSGSSSGSTNSSASGGNVESAAAYADKQVGRTGYGNNGCTAWVKEFLEKSGSPLYADMQKAGTNPMWVPSIHDYAKAHGLFKSPSQGGAKGDVVLLETNHNRGDGADHVVIATGDGKYWGNSSSRNKIVKSDLAGDYGSDNIIGYVATGSGVGNVATGQLKRSQAEVVGDAGSTSARGKSRWGRGFAIVDNLKNWWNNRDQRNARRYAGQDDSLAARYGHDSENEGYVAPTVSTTDQMADQRDEEFSGQEKIRTMSAEELAEAEQSGSSIKSIAQKKSTGEDATTEEIKKAAQEGNLETGDQTVQNITEQQQKASQTNLMDKFFGGVGARLDAISAKLAPLKSKIFSKLGSVISEKFGKFSDLIGDPLGMFGSIFGSSNNGGNSTGSNGGGGGTFNGDATAIPSSGSAAAALKKALNCEITSQFGPRNSGVHHGIDYGIGTGTPVPTVTDGVIDDIGSQGGSGYGNYVVVKDKKGMYHIYAHLSQNNLAKKGDSVRAGQIIAKSGHSGHCIPDGPDGSHLHYGIYNDPNCAGGTGCINPNTYDISGLSSPGKGKYGRGRLIKINPIKTKGSDEGGVDTKKYVSNSGKGKFKSTGLEDLDITRAAIYPDFPKEIKSPDNTFGITDNMITESKYGRGKYGRGFSLDSISSAISSFGNIFGQVSKIGNSISGLFHHPKGIFGNKQDQKSKSKTTTSTTATKAQTQQAILSADDPEVKKIEEEYKKEMESFNGIPTAQQQMMAQMGLHPAVKRERALKALIEKKKSNSITKAKDDSKFKLGQEGSHGAGPNGKKYTNNDIAYILKNSDKFGGAKTIEDAIKILEKDKKYTEKTETTKKEDKTTPDSGTTANSGEGVEEKNKNIKSGVTTPTQKTSQEASKPVSAQDKLDMLIAAQNKTNELLSAILNMAAKAIDVKESDVKAAEKTAKANNKKMNETAAMTKLNYFYNNSMKNSGVDTSFFNPDSGDFIDITKRMQNIASM